MSNIRKTDIADHDDTNVETHQGQLKSTDRDVIDLLTKMCCELNEIKLQLSYLSDEEIEGN